MYNYVITETAILSIRNFIKNYLDISVSLFTNSGINNLDIILENYRNSAKIFRDKIYEKIFETFSSEII